MTTTRTWRPAGLVAVLVVLGLVLVGIATPPQAYADTSPTRTAAGLRTQEPPANETGSFDGCPLLLEGQTSQCVVRLQSYLNAVNDDYNLPETGFFGPATRTAVLDFQGRNNLPADGNVGRTTAQELKSQAGGGVNETGDDNSSGGDDNGSTSTGSDSTDTGSDNTGPDNTGSDNTGSDEPGFEPDYPGQTEFMNCVGDAGGDVLKIKKLKKLYKLFKKGAKKSDLMDIATGIPHVSVVKIFWCLRHGPN